MTAAKETYDIKIDDSALNESGFTKFSLPITNGNASSNTAMMTVWNEDNTKIIYCHFYKSDLDRTVKSFEQKLLSDGEDWIDDNIARNLVTYFRNECLLLREDKSSGFFNGGNGKSKSKSKSTKKSKDVDDDDEDQESKPKEYTVFKSSKYTNLAEEITFGNRNVFLQITDDGKPVITDEIDLSEQENIILKPHERGTASPILPYLFKDTEEIEYFIKQAQAETIDSLFLKHKSIWRKIVVADKEVIVFLAIDSLYSYFQDKFATTHYDMFVGPPDSGKGAILVGFKYLGYRVVLASDMSGANLLDLLSPIEPNQITLAEDELDDIYQDPVKLKIYKVGYDGNAVIPRTLDGNTSSRSNRYYHTYSFKIFAAEESPDDKKLEGFKDRTFIKKAKKGKPHIYVKKLSEKTDSTKYIKVLSKIEYLRKLTLIFRLLHGSDIIEDVNTNIEGRALELTGPQIRLFNSDKLASSKKEQDKLPSLNNEVLPVLSSCLRDKGELTKKSLEATIYQALKVLLPTAEKRVILGGDNPIRLVLSNKEIYDKVQVLAEGSSIADKDHAFYCVEYDMVTEKRILKICRERFAAEDDHISCTVHDDKTGEDKQKKERALAFDENAVTKAATAFNVVSEIKILDPEAEDDDDDDNDEPGVWSNWKKAYNDNDDDDVDDDGDGYDNSNADDDNDDDSSSNVSTEESTGQSGTEIRKLGNIEVGTNNDNTRHSENETSVSNIDSSGSDHTNIEDLEKGVDNNQNIVESKSLPDSTDQQQNNQNNALISHNEPISVFASQNDGNNILEEGSNDVGGEGRTKTTNEGSLLLFKCFYCDECFDGNDGNDCNIKRINHIDIEHPGKPHYPSDEDFKNRLDR